MKSNANNKTPIAIHVETEIRDGKRKEMFSTEAEGTLYEKDNAVYLSYEEEMKEAGTVKTIVKMKEAEVVIVRSGAVSMRQQFLKGQVTTGLYQSPFGAMEMETDTRQIETEWPERTDKGRMSLSYLLTMQGQQTGRYNITITFKGI